MQSERFLGQHVQSQPITLDACQQFNAFNTKFYQVPGVQSTLLTRRRQFGARHIEARPGHRKFCISAARSHAERLLQRGAFRDFPGAATVWHR